MRLILYSVQLDVDEYLPVAGGSHRIEVTPFHFMGHKQHYKKL